MQLSIPKHLDRATFTKLNRKFMGSSNASISLPDDLSGNEIRELTQFLLLQIPDDLSYVLLADIVENVAFPPDLLEEVYRKGDLGCQVAVALRDDLSEQLQQLCAESPEDEVRSHYLSRKAHRERIQNTS
jgi:hypothetical protein